MCGMTTEEFWNGEPRVLQSYIKKHELELDEMNEQAWLSGFYVFKAINVVLSNCLSNKNAIAETYFEKPLEEFNSSYYMKEKQEKIDDNNYRKNTNYWAQIGTKGVH